MTDRETTWDEEDTTNKYPFVPGTLDDEVAKDAAMRTFVQRIFAEGVSSPILEMCEETRTVGRPVLKVPRIRREGDKLVIPVVAEKMVLVKRTILIEERLLRPVFEDDGEC